MKRKFYTVSIVLFIFVLMLPGSSLAHDDEHQAKGEHGSSELSEEGSGMKLHSEKHGKYKERGEYEGQGRSSEHMEEGSGMR